MHNPLDVAMVILSIASFILVAWMMIQTTKKLLAKTYARHVALHPEGNLRVTCWNYDEGKSEILSIQTTLPLHKRDAVIRAVRMWGIVRHKPIIEVAESSPKGEIFFRTY